MSILRRRGFSLGLAPNRTRPVSNNGDDWNRGLPILLAKRCHELLLTHLPDIKQTEKLLIAILEERDCDSILATEPYSQRLMPRFKSLGSAFHEGDEQEIETVMFDAINRNNIVAEDLWLKVSWLSFHDDDVSLRFRFSFGIDLEQDVAADPLRQQLAAQLCNAVFPESRIVTENKPLESQLKEIIKCENLSFVERILYFNGPNGGAYFHHDLERGHAGVVFAQLTGRTFWLALPKAALIEEIILFSKSQPWPNSLTAEMQTDMSELLSDRSYLSEQLGSFSNESLIHLINETQEFTQFLIERGHGLTMEAGDVLLLPQANEQSSCWHSVFCLGNEMGQALSFAIRPDN